jgi:hypothetical protein
LETIELLRDTLLKLRQSSMNIRSEKDLRNVMESYDMLFLGENFNRIYARELHHYMKKKLGLSLPHEEFLDLIPGVCDGLNMPYETLVFLNNPSKRADYQITLF